MSAHTLVKANFHRNVCICGSGSSNIHCSIYWQLVAGVHTLPVFGFLIEPVKYWLSVTEFVTLSARLYLFLLPNKTTNYRNSNAIFLTSTSNVKALFLSKPQILTVHFCLLIVTDFESRKSCLWEQFLILSLEIKQPLATTGVIYSGMIALSGQD